MSDWLTQKYVNLLSTRLRNYKRKSSTLYNFSCPFCGDSKLKNKARGYIYEVKGKMAFHCHNCNSSKSVDKFIKDLDLNLYNEMQLEKLRESGKRVETKPVEENPFAFKKPLNSSGPLKTLKKVSQLSHDHAIKKLVADRKIPNPYHAKLFACPNYMEFVNSIVPKKFDTSALKHDEARLLIPFYDKEGNLHAFQGRAVNKNSSVKYITIVLDETKPKIYGLDTVDFNQKVYVFEGPIDSMFIPNSIATAGGDMVSTLYDIKDHKSNMVIVYDNERRSRETYGKLDKAIMQGFSVCIWPENLEHKDVNDMILAGLSPEFIKFIIDKNTHKDLSAKLALTKWSKV